MCYDTENWSSKTLTWIFLRNGAESFFLGVGCAKNIFPITRFFSCTVGFTYYGRCWNLFFEALRRAKLTKPSAKDVRFLEFFSTFWKKKFEFFENWRRIYEENFEIFFIRKSKNSKNLDSKYHYFATLALLRASKNSFQHRP